MRLMHTKLPDFFKKVIAAGQKHGRPVNVEITGMENLKTAKMASASLGIIEEDINSITRDPDVELVEVTVLGQIPATIHTVVIKGTRKDGTKTKAYLDTLYISTPGPDYYCHDAEEVIDHRVQFN